MQWKESPAGQHVELGIAEHNLFLALGAFGLSRELSGVPLLPIGTLYDPVHHARARRPLPRALRRREVHRRGDALGSEPLARGRGASVRDHAGHRRRAARHRVLRARLRARGRVDPPRRARARSSTARGARASTCASPPSPWTSPWRPRRARSIGAPCCKGGYRLIDARGEPGWDPEANAVHLFAAGVMVPEAVEAARALRAEGILASVFVVTSPDRLYRGLRDPRPYLEELVTAEEEGVPDRLGPRRPLPRPRVPRLGPRRAPAGARRGPLRPVRQPPRPLRPLRHRRPRHRPRRPDPARKNPLVLRTHSAARNVGRVASGAAGARLRSGPFASVRSPQGCDSRMVGWRSWPRPAARRQARPPRASAAPESLSQADVEPAEGCDGCALVLAQNHGGRGGLEDRRAFDLEPAPARSRGRRPAPRASGRYRRDGSSAARRRRRRLVCSAGRLGSSPITATRALTRTTSWPGAL